MLRKVEIKIDTKEQLEEMFDLSKKIKTEITKTYEYDIEMAEALSIIVGTYVITKEFQLLSDFFIEGFKEIKHFGARINLLEDAKIMKDYILEEHKPNFNAIMRVLLEQIEKDLIIDYINKGE